MVKCIDENVGKLIDYVRNEGLLDKTIIVFISDHGDLRGEHHRHIRVFRWKLHQRSR